MNINPPRPEGQPGPEQPPKPPSIPTPESLPSPEAVHPQTAPHGEADLAPPSGDIVPPSPQPDFRGFLAAALLRGVSGQDTPKETSEQAAQPPAPAKSETEHSDTPAAVEQTVQSSEHDVPPAEPSPETPPPGKPRFRDLAAHFLQSSEGLPRPTEGGTPPGPPKPPREESSSSPEEQEPQGHSSVPFNPDNFHQADFGAGAPMVVDGTTRNILRTHADYADDPHTRPQGSNWPRTHGSLNVQCQLPNGIALSHVTDTGEVEVTILPQKPHDENEPPVTHKYQILETLNDKGEHILVKTRIGSGPYVSTREVGETEANQLAHMLLRSEPEHVSLGQIIETHDRSAGSAGHIQLSESQSGATELESVVDREHFHRVKELTMLGSVRRSVDKEQAKGAAITVTVGRTKQISDPRELGYVLPQAETMHEMHVQSVGKPSTPYVRVEATHEPDGSLLPLFAQDAIREAYNIPPDAALEQQTVIIYETVEVGKNLPDAPPEFTKPALLVTVKQYATHNGNILAPISGTTRYGTHADVADMRNFIRKPVYRTPQDDWRARHGRD